MNINTNNATAASDLPSTASAAVRHHSNGVDQPQNYQISNLKSPKNQTPTPQKQPTNPRQTAPNRGKSDQQNNRSQSWRCGMSPTVTKCHRFFNPAFWIPNPSLPSRSSREIPSDTGGHLWTQFKKDSLTIGCPACHLLTPSVGFCRLLTSKKGFFFIFEPSAGVEKLNSCCTEPRALNGGIKLL